MAIQPLFGLQAYAAFECLLLKFLPLGFNIEVKDCNLQAACKFDLSTKSVGNTKNILRHLLYVVDVRVDYHILS